MVKEFRVVILEKNCKQCGICTYFCPKNVLKQNPGCCPIVANPDACTGCKMCEMRCPDFAIEVEDIL